MYIPAVRHNVLVIVLTAISARIAVAQCPDGSPPPCRTAAAPAPAGRVPVDENLIAIFPFRITGTSTDAASLREGAMDLLALALDEQAGLRVVASRTLLARARSFTDASSIADAAAIARSVGAGSMVLGNAVVAGTQVRAQAQLHDLVRGRPVVSVEARGLAADPAPVIDSLAFSLSRVRLASGAGTARRALAEYATSPAALRLFLAGERSARAGLWQEAADSLVRAIALDSSFALAMHRLRVSLTYGATAGAWTAEQLIEQALRSPQRLPRRQLDMLQTAYAENEGNYREAMQRADLLMTNYPNDAEASYEAGEAYYHLGLAFGERPERALQAMERAIRLDSSLIDPYNHAAELRMMLGDSATALALARRGAAIAPTSTVHQAALMAMRAIVLRESAATLAAEPLPAAAGDVITRAGVEVWRAVSGDRSRAVTISEPFFRVGAGASRPRAYRVIALTRHAEALITEGRYQAARDTLSVLAQVDPANRSVQRTRVVAALMDGEGLPEAAADLRRGAIRPGLQTLGLLGLLAVRLRQPAALDSVIDALREIPQREPITGLYANAVVATLRGLDALSRADTVSAMRHLPEAVGVLPYSMSSELRFQDAIAWGMLALADLERARGQPEQALSRLHYFTFATGMVPLRAAADSLRARITGQRRP